jgi:GTP-binding protein
MLKVIEAYPPPATKGKYVKIKYCMQLPTKTPQFVFFATQYVKEPYKRYLENKIRDNWDFQVFQSIFILERNILFPYL